MNGTDTLLLLCWRRGWPQASDYGAELTIAEGQHGGASLAGMSYLLSRYRYAGEARAPWSYIPPLTLTWLAVAAIWIVVGDFILTGNSN